MKRGETRAKETKPVKEEKKETKPVKEEKKELLDPQVHTGEGDVFKDDHIRISLAMKKLEDKQVNILLRYYALDEELSDLSFSVRVHYGIHG